jgi:hypothetical protein
MPAIVVVLELVFGFDKGGFGLGNSRDNSISKLADRLDG